MFNIHFTTLFPRRTKQIQRERTSLISYGLELQDLLDQVDGLRDGLTVEALEWLTIDPNSDATRRYVDHISEELDRLDAEIAAIETRFFFAQDLYFELEAALTQAWPISDALLRRGLRASDDIIIEAQELVRS